VGRVFNGIYLSVLHSFTLTSATTVTKHCCNIVLESDYRTNSTSNMDCRTETRNVLTEVSVLLTTEKVEKVCGK